MADPSDEDIPAEIDGEKVHKAFHPEPRDDVERGEHEPADSDEVPGPADKGQSG